MVADWTTSTIDLRSSPRSRRPVIAELELPTAGDLAVDLAMEGDSRVVMARVVVPTRHGAVEGEDATHGWSSNGQVLWREASQEALDAPLGRKNGLTW
jgi:hypothetical protein